MPKSAHYPGGTESILHPALEAHIGHAEPLWVLLATTEPYLWII